jgi:hypothetical protein
VFDPFVSSTRVLGLLILSDTTICDTTNSLATASHKKMFSANENLLLRQHKRRVVSFVEACIPAEALDLVNVMVMQVACTDVGCVPLETVMVLVFDKIPDQAEPEHYQAVLPPLAESRGGSYKTKILKPLAEVTADDVTLALPPCFVGGRKTPSLLARHLILPAWQEMLETTSASESSSLLEFMIIQLQEYVAGRDTESVDDESTSSDEPHLVWRALRNLMHQLTFSESDPVLLAEQRRDLAQCVVQELKTVSVTMIGGTERHELTLELVTNRL